MLCNNKMFDWNVSQLEKTLANSQLLNQSVIWCNNKNYLVLSQSIKCVSLAEQAIERCILLLQVINQSMKESILARFGTHLLVSSNRWIFLCSSRLLALHADILHKSRREERRRRRNYWWSWKRRSSTSPEPQHLCPTSDPSHVLF